MSRINHRRETIPLNHRLTPFASLPPQEIAANLHNPLCNTNLLYSSSSLASSNFCPSAKLNSPWEKYRGIGIISLHPLEISLNGAPWDLSPQPWRALCALLPVPPSKLILDDKKLQIRLESQGKNKVEQRSLPLCALNAFLWAVSQGQHAKMRRFACRRPCRTHKKVGFYWEICAILLWFSGCQRQPQPPQYDQVITWPARCVNFGHSRPDFFGRYSTF